jgi:hypothetical protein
LSPVPSRLSANVLLLGKRAQMTILRRRQLVRVRPAPCCGDLTVA